MGSKNDPFKNQLKTLVSIEEAINKIIKDYESQKNKAPERRNPVFRSVFDPHTETTYTTKTVGKNIVIYGNDTESGGLKEGDYLLSPSNPNIVLASDCHGCLSTLRQKALCAP